MSWAHPIALLFIPVAIVAMWQLSCRAGEGVWMSLPHIHRLWADRHGLSAGPAARTRRLLRGGCLAAGSTAALLALARPQWGEIAEPRYEQSREVMLALDLSRSMLADDVAPSRLARAKLLIESLLDQLAGERVGLIVFSGTAFVQSPLSADYEVLRDFLDELDPSYLPEGGTDYESMLRTAAQAFGQQSDGDRYLVVLSDGEALDEHWQSLVPTLRERGIHVIGLGIGTPAGALVPDGQGGLVKDEHGAAVLSRLEPRTLQALAAETDGTYREAATWVDVAALIDATVELGRKGHYVEQRAVRLQDRYQWFLAASVLFLLLSYWIEFPLSPLARALPTRGRRSHPASAPAIAAALMGLAAWHTPRLASAAVSDPPPLPSGTASQLTALTATVADLSARSQLSATDYARLASDTIQFAAQPVASSNAGRSGVIDDALAAVDRGEQSDARAADWPALRRQLEQLRQVQPQPPQEPPQQNQKQDQARNQQGQSGAQNQREPGDGQAQPDGHTGSPRAQNKPGATDDQTGAEGNKSDSDTAKDPPDDGKGRGGGAEPAASAADHGVGHGEGEHTDQSSKGTAGEAPRADTVQPLDAPEAGLGDANQQKQPSQDNQTDDESTARAQPAAEAAPPEPKPMRRTVGGGRAVPAAPRQGATALAEAIDKMERVKEGDAPAVLFDRMSRAEGRPRAEKHSKNW